MTLQDLKIFNKKAGKFWGDNRGSELFDKMTLQKQKVYKGKDLENLKSANSTKANIERPNKRNHSFIHFKEEELDNEEPIFYKKSRLSKQLKVENIWEEESFYLCDQEYNCLVKPEHESTLVCINQDLLAEQMQRALIKCEDLLYSSRDELINNIKTEILDTASCILQNPACLGDCSGTSFPNVDRSCKLSSKLLGWDELEYGKSDTFSNNMEWFSERLDDDGELEMKESSFFCNELLHCSLNEDSTQYFDCVEESASPVVNLCGESSDELSDNEYGGELESRRLASFTEETLYCSLNEASTEFIEETEESMYSIEVGFPQESSDGFPDVRELETEESSSSNNESIPPLDEASTYCLEHTSAFHQEIAKSHCFHCPFSSEPTVEDVLNPKLSVDNAEHISMFYAPGSDKDGNNTSFSSQKILCQMHNIPVTQVSDIAIDGSFQSLEPNDSSYGSISALESEELGDKADKIPIVCEVLPNGSKDDTSIDHENHSLRGANDDHISSQESQHVVTASTTFRSLDDSLPLASCVLMPPVIEEATASLHESAKSSSGTCAPATGTEGLTAMKSFNNLHCEKLEHPTERLLSTRKVLSPSSQEYPCQTMADEELYESIKISNYRRQLWYENRTNASMTRTALKEAKVMMGSDGIMKKLMNGDNSDNGSVPSIAEDVFTSHTSCMESCTCTQCSLNCANAQKAIRFSLRQMHDMECFVMKLMKDLKSMKYNLEENLHSQLCPSADSPLKDSIGEMRKASLNAVRLEEITRKWHSVLTKDWKRFCKIMTLSDNVSTKSNICDRQHAKVRFADEVGGMLCRIKVFDANMDFVAH